MAVALVLSACAGTDRAPDAVGTPTALAPPAATSTPSGPGVDGSGDLVSDPPAPSAPAPPTVQDSVPPLTLEPVVSGLVAPLQALTHGGATLVVQQDGVVLELLAGGTTRPWLDLSDRVVYGGEQGLLGVAVLAGGDHLVAHYSATGSGATRLATVPLVDGRPDRDGLVVVLEVEQPAGNHNGGTVLVAPDGNVLLGLGDGGGAGDPFSNGQDASTLLGTVLRLDLSDPARVQIPADNPYASGGPGAPEVWLHGLRNPYRMAVGDGQLYIGDVGQDAVEEVTVVPLRPDARNLGWPVVEGDRCYAADPCDAAGFEPADVTYTHDDTGGCSVIAGSVYAGDAIPGLTGHLVYGDLCAGFLRTVRAVDGVVVSELDLGLSAAGLLSVGQDAAGELLLTFGDGRVLRLVPAA
jgi:glucose/arabinose dehydrogenase